MASKKIITVFGATGNQGGSVAQIFLHDPKLKDWTVRGVTRNADSDAAKKLASQGAEIVTADTNDKASLEKAMTGATAVFAVTNFWDKMDPALETQQGKNLADAAKAAGVAHFVWSSLLDVTKASGGRLAHVTHFDSKAKVEAHIREIGGLPATFFMPGLFMSSLAGMLLSQPAPGAPWTLALPTSDRAAVPVFTPADTGKWVKAIVRAGVGKLGDGRNIHAATAYLTPGQILDDFRQVFPEDGRTAQFASVPPEVYKGILMDKVGLPEPAAEDLLQNMQLLESPGYYAGAELGPSQAILEDELTTWREFAKTAPAFKELK